MFHGGGLSLGNLGNNVVPDDDYPKYQLEVDLQGDNEDHSGLVIPSEEAQLRQKEKETRMVRIVVLRDCMAQAHE